MKIFCFFLKFFHFKARVLRLQSLFVDQHGFRTNHSCETAFHSIIDNRKVSVSQKKVNLALFIDFKKAFDLINPRLLFLKLFHYGFDNNSLALLTDYFKDRKQITKIGSKSSSRLENWCPTRFSLGSTFIPYLY